MRRTIILLTAVFCITFGDAISAQNLVIRCLNIGNSDCTLIASPSGKTMMVDAGLPFMSSKSHLCQYLDSLGIVSLDYLIVTHYHNDHLGGVDTLVKHGISIDTVYDRGWWYCKTDYENKYIPSIDSIRHSLFNNQQIDLGAGVMVDIVSINGNGELITPYIDAECTTLVTADENDFSVALTVKYGEFSFLVGGDLSGVTGSGYHNIETSVGPKVGDIDIYRVNHHGSKYSTNQVFLDYLDPEVSILSVGNNNYGHPDSSVLNRLLNTSRVYETSDSDGNKIDGDIVITTNGSDGYYVNSDYYEIVSVDSRDQGRALPTSFSLAQNYPNPFNPSTRITFSLPRNARVEIDIYNLLGQYVTGIINRNMSAGKHEVIWKGTDAKGDLAASGIYFVRFCTTDFHEAKKIVLIR